MFKRLMLSILVSMIIVSLTTAISSQDDIESLSDLPGQIVFVGSDYNIYTADFATTSRSQLTDDADRRRHYIWPTWAMDGRLAYFCCDPQAFRGLNTEVYISQTGAQPGVNVYQNSNQSVTYAYWSPDGCVDGSGCLDLAVLLNNPNNLEVARIRNTDNLTVSKPLATGAPFYYSWSPNGSQMVTHRNARRIDIIDVNTHEITNSYELSSGAFQSPAWSPVDDRILFGAQGSEPGMTDLKVIGNGLVQTLARDLEGQIYFNWSPDGEFVAYTALSGEGSGTLFVIDSASGEEIVRSSIPGVFAFFWSPDSSKIAYISAATPRGTFNASNPRPVKVAALAQGRAGLAWSVLVVETGENIRYSDFLPTPESLYLLIYFDQFAQSHRIWSPDSTHIVYAEFADPENDPQPVISILDVSQLDTVPLTVANGVFAVWSFN